MTAYLYALPAIYLLATAVWHVSVRQTNVGIVDVFWSQFIWIGALFAFAAQPVTAATLVPFMLITCWAFRLSAYLLLRYRHENSEDRRYVAIREKYGERFRWISLPLIFLFQGTLGWIVSSIAFAFTPTNEPLPLLFWLGAIVSASGILYETIADRQLWQYKRAGSGPGYLASGLWRYSRHPNYFGESLVWWGLFTMALPYGQWWSIIAPMLMTWSLLKFSGVPLNEDNMAARRPGYQDYIATTPALVPSFINPRFIFNREQS